MCVCTCTLKQWMTSNSSTVSHWMTDIPPEGPRQLLTDMRQVCYNLLREAHWLKCPLLMICCLSLRMHCSLYLILCVLCFTVHGYLWCLCAWSMDDVVKILVIVSIHFVFIIPLTYSTLMLCWKFQFHTWTENLSNSKTLHCYERTLVSRWLCSLHTCIQTVHNAWVCLNRVQYESAVHTC